MFCKILRKKAYKLCYLRYKSLGILTFLPSEFYFCRASRKATKSFHRENLETNKFHQEVHKKFGRKIRNLVDKKSGNFLY